MPRKYHGKYRIESTRLKNFDYGSNGVYFITIVTRDRDNFFGKIIDNEIKLTPAGKIVKKNWYKIPQKFTFIRLDEFVVMPNHIHGILWIEKTDGAGDRSDGDNAGNRRDAINRVSTDTDTDTDTDTNTDMKTESKPEKMIGGITGKNNPMLQNNISRVIRWYKGRCTYEIKKFLTVFAGQSRFHDRIIRNENELNRIRKYIILNPRRWQKDRNNDEDW